MLTCLLLSLRLSSRSSPRTGSPAFCRADLRPGRVHSAENCGGSAVAVSCGLSSSWTRMLTCPRCCAVRRQGAARAVLAVMDVSVVMQRRRVSRTVEVPQIQFIAPFEDFQLCNRDWYSVQHWVAVYGGYGGDERGFWAVFFRIFRAPPGCPGVERQFLEPSMTKSSLSSTDLHAN